jgi:hypothetical protein
MNGHRQSVAEIPCKDGATVVFETAVDKDRQMSWGHPLRHYQFVAIRAHRQTPANPPTLGGAALFPAVELNFVWPGGTFPGFEKRL